MVEVEIATREILAAGAPPPVSRDDADDSIPSGTEAVEQHLADAVVLLSKGRPDRALLEASEACHCAPHLPQAHYLYGQAFAALGRYPEAERAFAAAIQLARSWADAWVNYGIARYRQGAIEDAKTAMREVLSFASGHSAATANLCAFLRISGGAEEAERILSNALERAPQDIGARLNIAVDLLSQERAAEALALLDAAAPPEDVLAYQHLILQRALALLQLKRPEQVRKTLERWADRGPLSPALIPLFHWRLVLLAMMEGDTGRARREARAMEASLSQAAAVVLPEHALMARFDLAKFWSGQGEAALAFAQWQAGHRMLREWQPFSRGAHRTFVDSCIETFSAERFRHGPRAGNEDRAPIFIVGMPRSGTTLIEQILDAHRDVHGAGERYALGQAFARLGDENPAPTAVGRIAALDEATLDAAASAYLAELHALAPEAARIVDKMPGNFNHLGLVGLMLPGARIIHCVRDPRDIGLSIFTFRFHGHHPYAHDLADLGWYIGEHDRLMAHWKAALPNPILTVALADWVNDFDGTLARLLAFLDLPPDPNCARFHEGEGRVRTVSRAQVRQPVNARGLGRWRAYAEELAPLIAELERTGSLEGWA